MQEEYRIYHISRTLKTSSKLILRVVGRIGLSAKSHMESINHADMIKIVKKIAYEENISPETKAICLSVLQSNTLKLSPKESKSGLSLDTLPKAAKKTPSKPLPDWVYAYTAWMKKRLLGRDITLVGHVRSMVSGKATFRCSNGHVWRTKCSAVAEGEGCPQCGVGSRTPEEIWGSAKLGYLCLLVHPEKLGFIRIGLTYNTLKQCYENNVWDDWVVHRYRFVEDPVLAERLIWELLGQSPLDNREPIKINLFDAEQAFQKLIYEMYREIALEEKKKEDILKAGSNN